MDLLTKEDRRAIATNNTENQDPMAAQAANRSGEDDTRHIAAPMARALARDGHQVVVSERNAAVAARLADAFETLSVAPNQAVVDACDTVFLCLRPALAQTVLPGLDFWPGQRIVSVMAGVQAADLAAWCAPATDISIMIPLGFLEQGGCPLAVYPNGAAITPLFGARNPVVDVPTESALNSHFAICALVPGLLAMLGRTGWPPRQATPMTRRFTPRSLPPGS